MKKKLMNFVSKAALVTTNSIKSAFEYGIVFGFSTFMLMGNFMKDVDLNHVLIASAVITAGIGVLAGGCSIADDITMIRKGNKPNIHKFTL